MLAENHVLEKELDEEKSTINEVESSELVVSVTSSSASLKEIFKKSLYTSFYFGGISAIFNSTDFINTAVLSQAGSDILAPVALIDSYSNFVFFLFQAPLSATSIIVSGENDKARTLQAAWLLALPLTISAMGLYSIAKPVLSVFGQPENLLSKVQTHFWLSLSAVPAYFLTRASYEFTLGFDKPLIPFLLYLISSPIFIFTTYAFSLEKLGLPKLATDGYGYAKIISSWTTFLLFELNFIFNKNFKRYPIHRLNLRGLSAHLKKLAKLGLPFSLALLGELSNMLAFSLFAGNLGEDELIARKVLTSYYSLLDIFAFTFFKSTSILISQAIANKEFANIKRYTMAGVCLAVIPRLVALPLFSLMPEKCSAAFIESNSNRAAIEILKTALPLCAASQVVDSARFALSGAVYGMQDAVVPTLIITIIQLFISIPLMYGLAFHTNLGFNGLVIGYGIGLTLITLLLYPRWQKKCDQLLNPSDVSTVDSLDQQEANLLEKSPAIENSKDDAKKTSNLKDYFLSYFFKKKKVSDLFESDNNLNSIDMNISAKKVIFPSNPKPV